MVELSGYILDRDVSIQFTRLRPGEKLHEELFIDLEQAEGTAHPRFFLLLRASAGNEDYSVGSKSIEKSDLEAALSVMCKLVREYGPLEQSQLLESHSILKVLPVLA